MGNRFKKILCAMDNSDSKHILVKRQFGDGTLGSISSISTQIFEDDNLTEEQRQMVFSGVPVFRKEESMFYEPFFRRERMIILGAGHVAVPLTMMAKLTGFHVIVIDDRADFADESRFPYADEVICDSFGKAIQTVRPRAQDYVVIITRGHANDEACIEALADYEEPVYTGLIGSRKRVATVFDRLRACGYDAGRLERIHTPIGLDIGAKTIEEIDIAIMAEIIKVRRKDSVGRALVDRGDHDLMAMKKISEITMPCAIATILEDKGSTPRAAGAVMAVFVDGTIIGSIGGGCVEGAVIHRAKELIGTGRYEIMDVSLDGNSAMSEGMVCGGKVTVLLEDYQEERL